MTLTLLHIPQSARKKVTIDDLLDQISQEGEKDSATLFPPSNSAPLTFSRADVSDPEHERKPLRPNSPR